MSSHKIILKSKNDFRTYSCGKLPNNIKYILVYDKFLTKSYVSVSVNIGSYNEYKEYYGLAHFLEHMLFMGSNKYPEENYFMNKLNEFGGKTNAYTTGLNTVYYFNVFNNGLEIILDIFSRFFIDPTFNKNSIEREINAINNEHLKNINNDFYSMYQLLLYLTNPDSILNTFPTGSLNTLNKNNLHEKMIEFYNKYYISNNISIAIISSFSCKKQFSLINKFFSLIPKKKNSKNLLKKPFLSLNYKKIYHIISITDIYIICFNWEIPIKNNYNYNDFYLLSFLLLHSNKYSLYFFLKNKGYIISINIDILKEGVYTIYLKLSKYGYDNINKIIQILFYYINKIINTNLINYIKYFKKISTINFNNIIINDLDDYSCFLSENNYFIKSNDILVSNYFINNTKSNKYYNKLYKKYININNCLIIISSNNYIINKDKYIKLKEYNTSYCFLENITNIKNIKNINNLSIDFINIINKSYLSNINNNLNKLNKHKNNIILLDKNTWYGYFNKYNEKIIYILLQLNNIIFIDSPKNYIYTKLACIVLNFLISTILYSAFDIGYNINFNFNSEISSIIINIEGNNNIHLFTLLLNDFINFITNINKHLDLISTNFLNSSLNKIKQNFININFLTPWKYNDILINYDINSKKYNIDTLIKYIYSIDNININDIKYYINNYIINNIKTSITKFIFGNLNYNNALLFNEILKIFNYKNKPELPPNIKLINKKIIYNFNKEKSNCIGYYYYIGKFKYKKYLLMNLFIIILSQNFFDELRTKYQLGYLVSMNIMLYNNIYYIYQKIQSNYNIDFIINKLDNYNNNIIKYINNINIDNYIDVLKNTLLEPNNNILDEYQMFVYEIISLNYLFNRKEKLLYYINKLNKKKLLSFINKYFNNNNSIKRLIINND